jgi:hypothetical protein
LGTERLKKGGLNGGERQLFGAVGNGKGRGRNLFLVIFAECNIHGDVISGVRIRAADLEQQCFGSAVQGNYRKKYQEKSNGKSYLTIALVIHRIPCSTIFPAHGRCHGLRFTRSCHQVPCSFAIDIQKNSKKQTTFRRKNFNKISG